MRARLRGGTQALPALVGGERSGQNRRHAFHRDRNHAPKGSNGQQWDSVKPGQHRIYPVRHVIRPIRQAADPRRPGSQRSNRAGSQPGCSAGEEWYAPQPHRPGVPQPYGQATQSPHKIILKKLIVQLIE